MMNASHHILNNFLNQMYLFKITADETPGFPKDVIKLYDKIIKDTNDQITALGEIEEISDQEIRKCIKPG